MNFLDYFSALAPEYARYRPGYPAEMFSFLAELSPDHELAWDCATGNGQAAVSLSELFSTVVATDASETQIANAFPRPNISYRVASAYQSGLAAASVSLITVANALHWFDLPAFFAEARRVLKPNGIIAVWCCNRSIVDDDVTEVIRRFKYQILGDYWSVRVQLVDKGYRTIDMPFQEVDAPEFCGETEWKAGEFLGYLRTWSASRAYCEATGEDPVQLIEKDLQAAWGQPDSTRRVGWPVELRVGRHVAG